MSAALQFVPGCVCPALNFQHPSAFPQAPFFIPASAAAAGAGAALDRAAMERTLKMPMYEQ
jgi:hypothetical protein